MAEIIQDRADLVAGVQKVRDAGGRVVLANGAFDVLHVGHIRYLEEAASLGDLLIVAVNSDESVAALKGPGRPVMPQADRMEIVAALESADLVCGFEGTKVTELLLLLKPDIHAKGTDYTKDNVPEVDTVRSYGGQVAITGDPKNHNSSELIARMRDAAAKETGR